MIGIGIVLVKVLMGKLQEVVRIYTDGDLNPYTDGSGNSYGSP